MPSYDARFLPDSGVTNSHVREHCSANRTEIKTIGADKGRQVRIERYAAGNRTLLALALYTVVDVHEQEP